MFKIFPGFGLHSYFLDAPSRCQRILRPGYGSHVGTLPSRQHRTPHPDAAIACNPFPLSAVHVIGVEDRRKGLLPSPILENSRVARAVVDMTDPSSCVSLGHGSSAEFAATAAVMHVSGKGEGVVEDNNVVLPTFTKTETSPPPNLPDSRVTQLVEPPEVQRDGEGTNKDKNVHPPPEIPPREPTLAHQAALRRLNGVFSNHRRVHEAIETSPSSSAFEPVLVRSYNNSTSADDPSGKVKMRNKGRSRADEKLCELPPLDRFSFQDILASIDSDVKGSIDAIAEICGRSRMSLADQYGSHLPPQGELTSLLEHGHVQSPQSRDLIAEQESSPTFQLTRNQNHRHSASLSLVGNLHPTGSVPLSAPVIATSNINFQPIPNSSTSEHVDTGTASSDPRSTLLPHVLSWLRGSSASFAPGGHEAQLADGDYNSAADALQRILRRIGEPPAPASVN